MASRSSSDSSDDSPVATVQPQRLCWHDRPKDGNHATTADFELSARNGRQGFNTMLQWARMMRSTDPDVKAARLEDQGQQRLDGCHEKKKPLIKDVDHVKSHRTAQESLKQFYKESIGTAGLEADSNRLNRVKTPPTRGLRWWIRVMTRCLNPIFMGL
ncbi:hypothetical protein K491DRAFT_727755 [Lophiostoma macrostomum CBS 122681]|uniref:Uncharacterized protein n=1 Tax=Lophiostoma macrostomum CBS 122681 TaxID=1314788 RepID=A0A6A6SYR1_9PLEO|nr:hypothetical protein K491DRAFT_727755 [Lophiostoma macrostomum CBS 122681]